MATPFDAYFGVSDETTYATGVAVAKFFEFTKESIAGKYERIESSALRNGTIADRADRFVPNPKGAAGDLTTEVLNQGHPFWLKHMLGNVVKSGAGPYTYVATPTNGSLTGKSFTAQVNRVDALGNNNIYTYEGGKIVSWELSNAVDGLLMLAFTCDFAKETIGAGSGVYAAAGSITYPTNGVLLSYVGGTVTVGGSAFDCKNVSVKVDNGLALDRYGIRANGTTKNEPREATSREITWSLEGEFQSIAHEQRVAALTAAGNLAAISFKWQTPDGAHSLQVDLPAARFDDDSVNVDGPGLLSNKITGKGLIPAAGGAPITATFISPDSAA